MEQDKNLKNKLINYNEKIKKLSSSKYLLEEVEKAQTVAKVAAEKARDLYVKYIESIK